MGVSVATTMNFLRWVGYALLGLVGAPLLIDILQPPHLYYHRSHLWYSLGGLAPLFAVHGGEALIHVLAGTWIAPSRKQGAALWAAIWAAVFTAMIYAPGNYHVAVFYWTATGGSLVGATAGWSAARRWLVRYPGESVAHRARS